MPELNLIAQPAIVRGSGIAIRHLLLSDTEMILRWRADEDVRRQMFSDRPPSREEHLEWFSVLGKRTDRQEFVVLFSDADVPAGTVGLSHITGVGGSAEYGILIGEPSLRGKGIARAASALLIEYAFSALQLACIFLNVFADNVRAIELYLSLGFIADPSGAGTRMKDGEMRDTVFMRLSKTRWLEQYGGRDTECSSSS